MENKIKSLIKKLSRFGFSVKPKNGGHHDPVCGMEASSDLLTAEHHGERYYFCSSHCMEQFIANPGDFVE